MPQFPQEPTCSSAIINDYDSKNGDLRQPVSGIDEECPMGFTTCRRPFVKLSEVIITDPLRGDVKEGEKDGDEDEGARIHDGVILVAAAL